MTGVRVLGPVAVDGTALTRRRERDLLCLLVAAGGRAVAPERLLAEVWGETGAPLSGVHVTVSRLRRRVAVERTAAGYLLGVPAGAVDAWEFQRLAEAALDLPTPDARLVGATRALERWTGEAYAGCAAPAARAEAHRLEDLRISVEELRAEALVALGHPGAAARVLAPLAEAHPYREALWAQLARALCAGSRQAEALEVLRVLRVRLAEDLGVDPSPEVGATEHRILTQDAALRVPAQRHGPSRRVRTRHCRAGLRPAAAQ